MLNYKKVIKKNFKINMKHIIFFILLTLIIFISCSPTNQGKYTKQILIVNGNSMKPIINNSQEITILTNYYNTNNPKRGEIIIYEYSENKNPIIKEIKGIPEDKFEYINNSIYINGKILKNSRNQPYNINSNMLKLYSEQYPIIPKNTYLILGNNPKGTFDSSKIGLVSKKAIIGYVEIQN